MFSAVNSGEVRNKLMASLPSSNSMMTLDEYNQYFKRMISVQSDDNKKEEIEKNHRSIVSSTIQAVIAQKKNERQKK
jgi:hypothetical protein